MRPAAHRRQSPLWQRTAVPSSLLPSVRVGNRSGSQPPAPQLAPQTNDTFDVFPAGLEDLNAAVVVFHPDHGNIFDTVTVFFGEYEQFRVEEPGLIGNLRHDRLHSAAADRLETALGV